jgi:hypothetical protein
VQLENVCQREIDRLELAGPALNHDASLSPRGVGIVAGEDLKRLAMLRYQPTADVADALADLLGGHDPQIAARKLLNQHGGTWGITMDLELAWNRDDVAVADATNLDDFHASSIYKDIRECDGAR